MLEIGTSKKRPHWEYKLGEVIVNKSNKEKDLGVTVRADLSPESHINKIVRESYNLLNKIRIAFNFMNEELLVRVLTSMVRPRLEYVAVVLSPHLKKYIN